MENKVSGDNKMTNFRQESIFHFEEFLHKFIETNFCQHRIDYWNKCREAASSIVEKAGSGDSKKFESDKKTSSNEKIEEEPPEWLKDFFSKNSSYRVLEELWVFPGCSVLDELHQLLENRSYKLLEKRLRAVVELLSNHGELGLRIYRQLNPQKDNLGVILDKCKVFRKHFTVLVVDDMPPEMCEQLIEILKKLERCVDDFAYDLVFVDNIEDAVFAVLMNQNIQACILQQDLPVQGKVLKAIGEVLNEITESSGKKALAPSNKDFLNALEGYSDKEEKIIPKSEEDLLQRGVMLGNLLRDLLPRLNLYLTLDQAVHLSKNVSGDDVSAFDRIFYRYDNVTEIHMTLLDGVHKKYRTPFFDSLKQYATRPVGNFHALPIARGHSVFNSPWLQDMRQFYGDNIFFSETSATAGGLDSLLDPKGPLKDAQMAAARTFGADHTFFVTNGTSTANKIVVQAIVKPGDIVLIDRNCHKSHHYGIILAGAKPLYLDAYWVKKHAIYGAVRMQGENSETKDKLEDKSKLKDKGKTFEKDIIEKDGILDKLKALKDAGLLKKVRMLLLTNCTFDGIVYNPYKVMNDVIDFLEKVKIEESKKKEEAKKEKTIKKEKETKKGNETKKDKEAGKEEGEKEQEIYFLWDEAWFGFARFFPNTIRRTAMHAAKRLEGKLKLGQNLHVYATQSTHKSLSCLRQGSMIHVFDKKFDKIRDAFHEAYYTHTSTSPNYQILASLDLARRQVDMEGFKIVNSAYLKAQTLRHVIKEDPTIKKYFSVLTEEDLIPGYRSKSAKDSGKSPVSSIYEQDHSEFILDPTRITLCTTEAAIGGNDFKVLELIDKCDIQVNKTSVNNVLFIITIGVTWGGVDHLLQSLTKLATEYKRREEGSTEEERKKIEEKRAELRKGITSEPGFTKFHNHFAEKNHSHVGNMREAFYLSYDLRKKQHYKLTTLLDEIKKKERQYVSASFIIPYPPGFPILVPGQVIKKNIIKFLLKIDIKEIHGYNESLGLPILEDLK